MRPALGAALALAAALLLAAPGGVSTAWGQEPGAPGAGQPSPAPGAPGLSDPADPTRPPADRDRAPGQEAGDVIRRGAPGAQDLPGAAGGAGADTVAGVGRPVFGADTSAQGDAGGAAGAAPDAEAGMRGADPAEGADAPGARVGEGAPGAPGAAVGEGPDAGAGAATPGPAGARGDTAPDGPGAPEAPLPVPPKPPVHQYRLGAGASAFAWEDGADVEDGVFAELEIERDVASFLALRAGLGYANTEVAGPGGEEGPDRVDTRLYLPELSLLLQPPLGGIGSTLVPYALVGFGALVTDPDRAGLNTRSSNSFAYGAGARLALGERLGVRGELRRHLIKLEDPLSPESDGAESVHNTRFGGTLTYSF